MQEEARLRDRMPRLVRKADGRLPVAQSVFISNGRDHLRCMAAGQWRTSHCRSNSSCDWGATSALAHDSSQVPPGYEKIF